MVDSELMSNIVAGMKAGTVIPYLGPGVLSNVKNIGGNRTLPADSDSLILAMNNGQPMAPRLMYEFPRAAMNLELKKGRSFVERFLTDTYGAEQWQRARLHQWLADIKPHYVIDINRDTQLQDSYRSTSHTLIVGTARIASDFRFKLFHYDGQTYHSIEQCHVDVNLPIIFKPMGTPVPEPTYIASDADYVDYITELMGGFALPGFVKEYRKGKRYLLLGMSLTRDTERMVLSDIIYAADNPSGWAFIPSPTEKEQRFCAARKIDIVDASWEALLPSNSSAVEIA